MEDVRPPDLPATPRSSPPGPNRRGGWRSVQIVEGFQARFILTNLSYLTASLLGVAFVLFSKPTWVLLTRPPGQDTAATASTFLLLHALVWPTLVAIVLLGKWAFAAIRDYHRQSADGSDPVFVAEQAGLPGVLEGDIWSGRLAGSGRDVPA